MNLTERIAYIKGLAEGLSLDKDRPEVKVINAMLDLIGDMAYDLKEMENLVDELSAQVEEIDEDLADVETDLFDDFDRSRYDRRSADYYDSDFDDDDDFDFDDDDMFYEVRCSSCGKTINVSEDVLLEGEIECPDCGEILEFDFSSLFEDDDEFCDTDCESCNISDCEGKSDVDPEESDEKDTPSE